MLFNLAEFGTPLISLFSVFLFLPISLTIYYLLATKYREPALLLISITFILLVAPRQLPFILILVLLNYVINKQINEAPKNHTVYRRILLLFSIFINLGVWIFFNLRSNFRSYPYLLGGAVIPFLLFDTNLSTYKNRMETSNFSRYALYSLFFPRLFAGPFNSLEDFFKEKAEDFDIKKAMESGSGKFVKGGIQFIFLGVRLINLAETIGKIDSINETKLSLWTMTLVLALGIYHTLVGASTAAQGISEMFGFNLGKGWNYPFNVSTVSEFCHKFNGSLESFLWRGINISKLKRKYGIINQMATIFVMGIIMGLWLDFSFEFLAWGLCIVFFFICESFVLREYFKKAPNWKNKVFTYIAVILSFSILCLGYNGWSWETVKLLFGFTTDMDKLVNKQILYYLNSYLILIVLAIVLSSKLFRDFVKMISETLPLVKKAGGILVNLILFVILIALII